jgi:hypothetical protein
VAAWTLKKVMLPPQVITSGAVLNGVWVVQCKCVGVDCGVAMECVGSKNFHCIRFGLNEIEFFVAPPLRQMATHCGIQHSTALPAI